MLNEELKNQIITLLFQYKPEMIGIFGSYSRGDNGKESDLDILVSFKDKISLLTLVIIEQKLSDALGIKVDLVTVNGLKNNRLKKFIYQDLVQIFNEKERLSIS